MNKPAGNGGTERHSTGAWLAGIALLAVLLAVIFFRTPEVPFFQDLPHMDLFRRCFFILFLCMALCLYRICRGPTPPDRAVAIDILGIVIVGFCAILAIPTGRSWYIDIGIAWALQSFIGALCLAKHLEGKRFDE
ncbi:MAG: cation:proton antiporter [Candidatus Tritonobacter lacicola]|nr:cation:proton antiporter [Candidatus Tritonobacter lacicola]